MAKIKVEPGNVTPLFLLFLTFLVLKLTKVVSWSWAWVTAPLWGGIALSAAFMAAIGAFVLVVAILERLRGRP